MSGADRGSAFWSFSTALYARPGVAPACLALQDRFGADVNLLLFCLWAAAGGCALEAAEFTALEAAIAPWRREVVEPLRAVRRALKSDPRGAAPGCASAFRERLLALEIEAERIGQGLLAEAVPAPAAPGGAPDPELARRNLDGYLAWRRIDTPTARQLAATILAA